MVRSRTNGFVPVGGTKRGNLVFARVAGKVGIHVFVSLHGIDDLVGPCRLVQSKMREVDDQVWMPRKHALEPRRQSEGIVPRPPVEIPAPRSGSRWESGFLSHQANNGSSARQAVIVTHAWIQFHTLGRVFLFPRTPR
jgi:hypothetical protein